MTNGAASFNAYLNRWIRKQIVMNLAGVAFATLILTYLIFVQFAPVPASHELFSGFVLLFVPFLMVSQCVETVFRSRRDFRKTLPVNEIVEDRIGTVIEPRDPWRDYGVPAFFFGLAAALCAAIPGAVPQSIRSTPLLTGFFVFVLTAIPLSISLYLVLRDDLRVWSLFLSAGRPLSGVRRRSYVGLGLILPQALIQVMINGAIGYRIFDFYMKTNHVALVSIWTVAFETAATFSIVTVLSWMFALTRTQSDAVAGMHLVGKRRQSFPHLAAGYAVLCLLSFMAVILPCSLLGVDALGIGVAIGCKSVSAAVAVAVGSWAGYLDGLHPESGILPSGGILGFWTRCKKVHDP